MVHGISIVVQGSTFRQSSDKSFLMPLSLVCGTKMSYGYGYVIVLRRISD